MKKLFLLATIAALFTLSACHKDNDRVPAPIDTNNWVDLGLPSGLLWAKCNLGANAPEENGNHYAWGETQPKEFYMWNNYIYGSFDNVTKYCSNAEFGYNGLTDTLTTLEAMDDAATVALGIGARTPTKAEWEELCNNTTSMWVMQNGVRGKLFIGPNGNTLFLRPAGVRSGWSLGSTEYGYYWSSSLCTNSNSAWCFEMNDQCMVGVTRECGLPVRPVHSAQ